MVEETTTVDTATIVAPEVAEVINEMKSLEPFIPESLVDLHNAPSGDKDGNRKYISRYRKGSVGPVIPESISVNSGTDNVTGVGVSLRESSHYTGWDYSNRRNTYNEQKSVHIALTFNDLGGNAEQRAAEILDFPKAPSGYTIREGKKGREVKSFYADGDVTTVKAALRANYTATGTNPSPNRFADKYITELGDGATISMHVNIGGGAYRESVYYDKVKSQSFTEIL